MVATQLQCAESGGMEKLQQKVAGMEASECARDLEQARQQSVEEGKVKGGMLIYKETHDVGF